MAQSFATALGDTRTISDGQRNIANNGSDIEIGFILCICKWRQRCGTLF